MKNWCLGIDIGGTSVKFGLFDMEGILLKKWSIPTRIQEKGKNILKDIAVSLEKNFTIWGLGREQIVGAGIGVPGLVIEDGTVLHAENLGWDRKAVAREMKNLTGIQVKVENDANLAALGEIWKGSGKNCHSMLFVTLGTGIGCGIVINDKILSGVSGAAGEIGHMHVEDYMTKQCNCGKYGCLEQFASATGICWMGQRALEESAEDSILRGQEMSARIVFDAVRKQDSLAVQIVEKFGYYLGKALAASACIINPERIVIGGGVSMAGNIILDYVEKYYHKYAYPPCENIEFRLASLGSEAGIYGGARLIYQEKNKDME